MVKKSVRRGIAIWLSTLLICLSFAASAHSAKHISIDGAQHHCSLCFHKHLLNKLLPTHPFDLTISLQTFEASSFHLVEQASQHTSLFQSRAPPVAA